MDFVWYWDAKTGKRHATRLTEDGRRVYLCVSVFTDEHDVWRPEIASKHPRTPVCQVCLAASGDDPDIARATNVEWYWFSLDGKRHASLPTKSGYRMYLCRGFYTGDQLFPSEPASLHLDAPECQTCKDKVAKGEGLPGDGTSF